MSSLAFLHALGSCIPCLSQKNPPGDTGGKRHFHSNSVIIRIDDIDGEAYSVIIASHQERNGGLTKGDEDHVLEL